MKTLTEISKDNKLYIDKAIPKDEAHQKIKKYRSWKPNDVKSIWIDREIIDYIIENNANLDFSGIRIYLARETDTSAMATAILALTQLVQDPEPHHRDRPDGFFNYGNPCPPQSGCKGDLDVVK